ncbi:MAG: ABC transporter substrate-binding protein [Polyangiaceae bacterium]
MNLGGTVAWVVIAALSGGVAACSATATPPESDLAADKDAQENFGNLRLEWEARGPDATLEPALATHASRFKNDPTARVARAMLALVLLEKGDVEKAEPLAQLVADGPEGATRDMATVALGSIARRRGDSKGALATLSKLFNRIIDPPTRAILNRELLLAAVAERDFAAAEKYLRALLRQSSPEMRQSVEVFASHFVTSLPPATLLSLLRTESQAERPDRWLLTVVAEQVAEIVKASQDPSLARELLEIAAPLLRDQADAIARVAARGAEVRLERNTVGLAMPLRSDALRRRGIEVAAGLALALDIPGSKTRLLIRDDQRDVNTTTETLSLLSADGAAVIVAGFDTKEADLALAYAERARVPLLLLRPPSRPVAPNGTVFVLGDDPAEARAALVLALAERGRKRVAVLTEDREVADLPASVAGNVVAVQPCGAPIDFVRGSGATAVLIEGGEDCVGDAVAALDGTFTVALGLDAPMIERSGPSAGSGLFPFPRSETPAKDDLLLTHFREKEHGDPSWWVALGHDAGLLVKDAVSELPPDDREGASADARRASVIDHLEHDERQLWTSDRGGFGGARVLPRSVRVVERGRR